MPKTLGFTLIRTKGFTLIRTIRKNLISVKGFTLIELLIVISIIGILASIGLATFNSSQAKSRDAKRKANLQQIGNALELYYNDKGQYPASSGGNIMGCGTGAITVCTWGTSTFSNLTTGTVYMINLPADPMSQYNYYYVATPVLGLNTSYVLYAHLEDAQDRNIIANPFYTTQCGGACDYGVSSANTKPL